MEPERNHLNPHNIDPGRIDRAPGFDSIRPGQNIKLMADEVKIDHTPAATYIGGKKLNTEEAWEWIQDAIDQKAKRVPDVETGMVPCGCGGKAEMLTNVAGNLYGAECRSCFVGTDFQRDEKEVVKDWNRAMGWRAEK